MRLSNYLLLLLLVGCAPALVGCTTMEPIVEYRERVVPVKVECVDLDALPVAPDYATRHVTSDYTLEQVSDAYMIERSQLHGHVAELNAVIEGCKPNG